MNSNRSRGNQPKIKVIDTKLAVFDLNIAIHDRHLRLLALNFQFGKGTSKFVRSVVRGRSLRCSELAGLLAEELGSFEPGAAGLVDITSILGLVSSKPSSVAAVQSKFSRLESGEKLGVELDGRRTYIARYVWPSRCKGVSIIW